MSHVAGHLGFEQAKGKVVNPTGGVVGTKPQPPPTTLPITPDVSIAGGFGGLNIPEIGSVSPGGEGQESLGFGPITQQEFIKSVLPSFLEFLKSDIPLKQASVIGQLDESLRPSQVGLFDVLEGIEGLDIRGGGEFVPTESISLESIENDPLFKSFSTDLQVETDKATEALINEMARRGITVSGATEEGFGDISEAQNRAITSEIGRLQSPLISASILNQAINEPIRQTGFNQGIANRLLGLGLSERDILQAGGEGDIRFDTENFLRREQQASAIRNLPFEQEQAALGTLAQRLNLPLSILTGTQVAGQGGLAREQIAAENERALQRDKALRDIQESQLTGGLFTAGAGLLGSLGGSLASSGALSSLFESDTIFEPDTILPDIDFGVKGGF